MTPNQIKLNDVYSFRYREGKCGIYGDPYHCFDGQLIVKAGKEGELYLEDTYWSSDNRVFTIDEAQSKGVLTFKVNLDDVVPIGKSEVDYFADEDVFDLSYQHGSYTRYVRKKEAERSKVKMLSVLEEQVQKWEREIESLRRRLDCAKESKVKIETGNLNVYL